MLVFVLPWWPSVDPSQVDSGGFCHVAEELPVYVAVASPAYLHQYCLEGRHRRTWCEQVSRGAWFTPITARECSAVEFTDTQSEDRDPIRRLLSDGFLATWSRTGRPRAQSRPNAGCRRPGGTQTCVTSASLVFLCVILFLQYSMTYSLEIVIFFI